MRRASIGAPTAGPPSLSIAKARCSRARLAQPVDNLGRLSRQRRLDRAAQRPERRGRRHAVKQPAGLRRIVDQQGFDDQPHRPERRARRDFGDERFDLVRRLLRRQSRQRLMRRIGGGDPFDARRRIAVACRERNRTRQEQRRRQLGQQASLAWLQGVGPDVFQSLGERLMDLALADEAGEQEQRLPDGAVERYRVAENDLGLLEQPLGEQRLGPAHIGSGEGVPPVRPGLLLEELLIEFDRLLESAEAKRLLGLGGERVGRCCGRKLARVLFGHAGRLLAMSPRSCRLPDARPPPFIPNL